MDTKSVIILLLGFLILLTGQQSSHGAAAGVPVGTVPPPAPHHPSVVKVIATNKETGRRQQATGFFINPAGDVVTNYHAIAGTDTIHIWTNGTVDFPVTRIIWQDIAADLVVMAVRIPVAEVHPAVIANHLPQPGEAIEVIGHPFGQPQHSSRGVIASWFPAPIVDTLLQFTAPINSGESGSPLFDTKGQVVGVASFILYLGTTKSPCYFAIPASRLALRHGLSPATPQ